MSIQFNARSAWRIAAPVESEEDDDEAGFAAPAPPIGPGLFPATNTSILEQEDRNEPPSLFTHDLAMPNFNLPPPRPAPEVDHAHIRALARRFFPNQSVIED